MARKKKKSNLGGIAFIAFLLVAAMLILWLIYGEQPKDSEKDPLISAEPATDNQDEISTEPETVTDNTESSKESTEDIEAEENIEEEVVDEIDQVLDETGFDYDIDPETIENETYPWSWERNTEHKPVRAYTDIDISVYGAYYMANTDQKVIYLTFDEGYENGYTSQILDILLEKGVKAAFFVTESYITGNPELVMRMKEEGHIVGNHSSTHPSMPSLSVTDLENEILKTEATMEELTGYEMDQFFRPPMGEWSERSLYLTRRLNYRTIFWSMAYADWDVENQPGQEAAYDHVMTNYHNGCIILLHAVSESNTLALGDIIDGLHNEGYRFGQLYEVE